MIQRYCDLCGNAIVGENYTSDTHSLPFNAISPGGFTGARMAVVTLNDKTLNKDSQPDICLFCAIKNLAKKLDEKSEITIVITPK